MRLLFGLTAVGTFLVLACGRGGGPSPEALEAVRAVAFLPELGYREPMPVVDS